MQKAGIILIISGMLIVTGLILLVLGNQMVLEGVSQGNGKVSTEQTLSFSADFNMKETPIGVFAVQIMEFKDNTFSARILDPSGNETVFQIINEETIENRFDVLQNGSYKLVIESRDSTETQVFGAIGPIPDTEKKILGFVSVYILVAGMIGLIGAGIYEVKNRRKSI